MATLADLYAQTGEKMDPAGAAYWSSTLGVDPNTQLTPQQAATWNYSNQQALAAQPSSGLTALQPGPTTTGSDPIANQPTYTDANPYGTTVGSGGQLWVPTTGGVNINVAGNPYYANLMNASATGTLKAVPGSDTGLINLVDASGNVIASDISPSKVDKSTGVGAYQFSIPNPGSEGTINVALAANPATGKVAPIDTKTQMAYTPGAGGGFLGQSGLGSLLNIALPVLASSFLTPAIGELLGGIGGVAGADAAAAGTLGSGTLTNALANAASTGLLDAVTGQNPSNILTSGLGSLATGALPSGGLTSSPTANAALMSGAKTALSDVLSGQNTSNILPAILGGAAGSAAGQTADLGKVGNQLAANIAGNATTAALQEKDPLQAAINSAITTGAGTVGKQAGNALANSLTADNTPASSLAQLAAADTGTMSDVTAPTTGALPTSNTKLNNPPGVPSDFSIDPIRTELDGSPVFTGNNPDVMYDAAGIKYTYDPVTDTFLSDSGQRLNTQMNMSIYTQSTPPEGNGSVSGSISGVAGGNPATSDSSGALSLAAPSQQTDTTSTALKPGANTLPVPTPPTPAPSPLAVASTVAQVQQTGKVTPSVAQTMDANNVSPAQVATSIDTPVAVVQDQYNQVNPNGTFSTVSSGGGGSNTSNAQGGLPSRPDNVPTNFELTNSGNWADPTNQNPTLYSPTGQVIGSIGDSGTVSVTAPSNTVPEISPISVTLPHQDTTPQLDPISVTLPPNVTQPEITTSPTGTTTYYGPGTTETPSTPSTPSTPTISTSYTPTVYTPSAPITKPTSTVTSGIPSTIEQPGGGKIPGYLSGTEIGTGPAQPVKNILGALTQLKKELADSGLSALEPALLKHLIKHKATGGTIHKSGHPEAAYGEPIFRTGGPSHYVDGKGDGQSDDIPAMLAKNEYVFDADTVAQLGNGSSEAGAKLLDKFREAVRRHKRSAPANTIPPKAKKLTSYLKEAERG
jgi:hypothetical protein